MPSVLGFTVASVCLYHFVRKKLGRFYGLTAVLVFWLSPFLRYATEARPYALMVGFLALAMLGWQAAIEGQRRRLGIFAVAFGVCGLLVSHVFGAVVVGFLGLAELVRSIDRRRMDWPVWAALVAPTPLVIIYIPILRRFQHWTAVPPVFQASPTQIVAFYAELLSSVGVVLLIALTVALLISRSDGESKRNFPAAQKHEIALVLGLLSFPIAINLLLMPAGGAFWPRYGIPSAIAFSLLFVYVLAKVTNASRAAAAIVAVFVLSGIAFGFVWQIVQPRGREMVKQFSLQELDPLLPIVDAGGVTFIEMNKREDPALLARVFYLTDRDAALRYAHATIFEDSEILHKYWPIRGNVTAYADFVRRTPHFFVLGTPDYPEDWLIPKLLDDGADLQFKGELRQSSYKDYMIFEVRMSPAITPGQQ